MNHFPDSSSLKNIFNDFPFRQNGLLMTKGGKVLSCPCMIHPSIHKLCCTHPFTALYLVSFWLMSLCVKTDFML